MKKHILPIIAITSMLCMFHDSPALADQPASSFGIVQITKVYQESQGARLAAERTNQLQKAAAEKLQSIKDDLALMPAWIKDLITEQYEQQVF